MRGLKHPGPVEGTASLVFPAPAGVEGIIDTDAALPQ